MTRDEILNMPAGREMDALVAKNVMKLEFPVYEFDGYKHQYKPKPYSTNIAAAWEVVDKINSQESLYNFELSKDDKSWMCEWWSKETQEPIWATADTAPLAICRAALLAVMESRK